MTAGDYVKKYHDILVPQFNTGSGHWQLFGGNWVHAPVNEYCNSGKVNRAGKSHSQRWELYTTLIQFFRDKMAKKGDSGVEWSGDSVTLYNSWAPIHGLSKGSCQRCFEGKGTPEMLAQVIQLISYWRSYLAQVEGKTVAAVGDIVDKYLGMDCNGFVGRYLNAKFPGIAVTHSTPEEQYLVEAKWKKGKFKTRTDELQADDIVVFSGHITVIDRVLSQDSKTARVRMAESRTATKKDGGPQVNDWTFKTKSGGLDIVSRDAVKGVVRLAGMS